MIRVEWVNCSGRWRTFTESTIEEAREYLEKIQITENEWAKDEGRVPLRIVKKAKFYNRDGRIKDIRAGKDEIDRFLLLEISDGVENNKQMECSVVL